MKIYELIHILHKCGISVIEVNVKEEQKIWGSYNFSHMVKNTYILTVIYDIMFLYHKLFIIWIEVQYQSKIIMVGFDY
jgi:hypothetical protein